MFSLHTHTVEFDGQNSVAEMVAKAKRIGYTSIGISNHFIVYPNIDKSAMYQAALHPKYDKIKPYYKMYSTSFDEALDKFKYHYDEIERVKSENSFPIYKGMEVDFFQYKGWSDGFEKAINILKPDYIIGSAHFSVQNDKILNMRDILFLNETERTEIVHKYWDNVQKAIQSGYFDFMAHLDLYKRHNLGAEECFRADEEKTVACLAEYKIPAEINTGSLRKKNKYGKDYDEAALLHLLQLFAQFNIPTMLSDDAHRTADLGASYDIAAQLAKQENIRTYCQPIKLQNKFRLEQYLSIQNEKLL